MKKNKIEFKNIFIDSIKIDFINIIQIYYYNFINI